RPPSEAMLWATFAAPPRRYSSRSNRTTGTGASGEMRSTRPIMNWSSMTSPMTVILRPANPDSRSATRHLRLCRRRLRPRGSERQRDQAEEQHQKFRVAEVVLEHARCEHRDSCRESSGGHRRRDFGPQQAPVRYPRGGHEPEPERHGRKAAFSRDLNRVVVQMRIDRIHRLRIFHAIALVLSRDHLDRKSGVWGK